MIQCFCVMTIGPANTNTQIFALPFTLVLQTQHTLTSLCKQLPSYDAKRVEPLTTS